MDEIVEDLVAEVKLQLDEMKSSLIVLHYALQNDYKDLTFEDIDNCIEILSEKVNTIYNKLLEFEQNN